MEFFMPQQTYHYASFAAGFSFICFHSGIGELRAALRGV
jgi:hypothetical protein